MYIAEDCMEPIVDYMKNASEVRKEWSSTIDTAIRERPVFFQRTRDNLALLDIATLQLAFRDLHFDLTFFNEEDGSVTCAEEHLDLVENALTRDECILKMFHAIRDYASDYYDEFTLWSKAPNRQGHIPYVLKVLVSTDAEIREDMICHDGKN